MIIYDVVEIGTFYYKVSYYPIFMHFEIEIYKIKLAITSNVKYCH